VPRSRKFSLAMVVTALTALVLATPAAAQTPKGQGLVTVADQGIVLQSCSDPSILSETVLTPRGGGKATWVTDGRMYVLKSISVVAVITPEEGDPFTETFEQSFGMKTGLSSTITCDFTQSFPGIEVTGVATLAQVH
jgi:hypothetical protein